MAAGRHEVPGAERVDRPRACASVGPAPGSGRARRPGWGGPWICGCGWTPRLPSRWPTPRSLTNRVWRTNEWKKNNRREDKQIGESVLGSQTEEDGGVFSLARPPCITRNNKPTSPHLATHPPWRPTRKPRTGSGAGARTTTRPPRTGAGPARARAPARRPPPPPPPPPTAPPPRTAPPRTRTPAPARPARRALSGAAPIGKFETRRRSGEERGGDPPPIAGDGCLWARAEWAGELPGHAALCAGDRGRTRGPCPGQRSCVIAGRSTPAVGVVPTSIWRALTPSPHSPLLFLNTASWSAPPTPTRMMAAAWSGPPRTRPWKICGRRAMRSRCVEKGGRGRTCRGRPPSSPIPSAPPSPRPSSASLIPRQPTLLPVC